MLEINQLPELETKTERAEAVMDSLLNSMTESLPPMFRTLIPLYLPKLKQSFNDDTVDLFLEQIKELLQYIEVGHVTTDDKAE